MPRAKRHEEWDAWSCPHPDCETKEKEYNDPSSIKETTCDEGHSVKLVWKDGDVSARLAGRAFKHDWRISFTGSWMFCWHCNDKSNAMRLPVYGCVRHA